MHATRLLSASFLWRSRSGGHVAQSFSGNQATFTVDRRGSLNVANRSVSHLNAGATLSDNSRVLPQQRKYHCIPQRTELHASPLSSHSRHRALC